MINIKKIIAATIHSGCQKIRSVFRVLGIYNFGLSMAWAIAKLVMVLYTCALLYSNFNQYIPLLFARLAPVHTT